MDENLKKEVGEAISLKEIKRLRLKRSIIDDGKQLTIRIPEEFSKEFGVDPNKHEFEFILAKERKKTRLIGEVVDIE